MLSSIRWQSISVEVTLQSWTQNSEREFWIIASPEDGEEPASQ
jgi:hypothetical protein